MDQMYIWLIVAIVFILSEIVIPGGVVIFLGLSALVVFGLLKLGLVDTLFMSLIIWFISSIVMLLVLRSFFMKYFEGDSRVQATDEDEDAHGKIAIVKEELTPSKIGRIDFLGTTWEAKSDYSFKVNEKVIIIKREANTWIVGPID